MLVPCCTRRAVHAEERRGAIAASDHRPDPLPEEGCHVTFAGGPVSQTRDAPGPAGRTAAREDFEGIMRREAERHAWGCTKESYHADFCDGEDRPEWL